MGIERQSWDTFFNFALVKRASVSDEEALENKLMYPKWNGNNIYSVDDRVQDGDNLYKRIQPQTATEIYAPHEAPALWVRVWIEEYPEWVQPTGVHDSYQVGAKVSHNGKHWVNNYQNNSYEPGIYGWTEH